MEYVIFTLNVADSIFMTFRFLPLYLRVTVFWPWISEPLPPAIARRTSPSDSSAAHPAAPPASDVLVNKQYNSPIGLYSNQNVQSLAKASHVGQLPPKASPISQSHRVDDDGTETVTVAYKIDPDR